MRSATASRWCFRNRRFTSVMMRVWACAKTGNRLEHAPQPGSMQSTGIREALMADDVKIAQAEMFDVGGVEMVRPFCIRRLGHFGLDVLDIEACRDFYERMMGLRVADPLDLGGRL